jgi:hypothetical protein
MLHRRTPSILVPDLAVSSFLVLDMERGTVLGLALAPVIEAGSGDIGVAQPFLDLGDVRLMRERVGRRVARSECTHSPFTSALMPEAIPYFTCGRHFNLHGGWALGRLSVFHGAPRSLRTSAVLHRRIG